MTKANQFAIANRIPFDTELVDEKIEELIALSKEVNKREKGRHNTQPMIFPAK